ncbi:hypothetical protein CASFOL_036267 [Castilleja foliolosa]|uniref:30S ribosomal protein 3, chloroplastic n=1 Tax=Castilleja foliolosa TaxID=1961234 RepID=A0ABD3BXG3_9LAMI
MLSSLGIQSAPNIHLSNLSLSKNSHHNQISPIPKTQSLSPITPNKLKPKSIKISSSFSSSSQTLDESISDDKNAEKRKRGVVVKPLGRPRLVLKFIWMEKNIGIALDQVIPGGHGTIPLSPYYFWPRKDAWEELRVMLESKQWISKKEMVVLLNQATDIINLWQESGGGDLA